MQQNLKLLRRRAVEDWTGLSRSTIYEMIKAGTFPAPVPLGARAVGWLSIEVQAWVDARVAQRKAA